MLYKWLWDNMVVSPFLDDSFVDFFGLHKHQELSPEVQTFAQNAFCNPSVSLRHCFKVSNAKSHLNMRAMQGRKGT